MAEFRLAFLTMVWRDYWLLEKWIAHNARLVGKRDLYVINHGGDPRVDAIAEGCNVIHVPRDEVSIDLTRLRWTLKGQITNGLLAFYDAVVCTDVDEFLVYRGPLADLRAHLAQGAGTRDVDAVSPVGLNIVPREDEPLDPDIPVLTRHRQAHLSGKYTKPCIALAPVNYTVGGHGLVKGRFAIDPHVALFHLHYVTPDYAERMAERQKIVADARAHNAAAETPQDVPGRFWINWAKPDVIRDKERGLIARATPVDISKDFEECARLLQTGVRHIGRRVVVEQSAIEGAPYVVTIPDSLGDAI